MAENSRTRLAALRERLRRERETHPGRFAAVAGMVAALAVLLVFLLLAPKPWSSGIARARALGADLDVVDYLVTGLWYASLVNAALLAIALATRRLWLRTGPVSEAAALAPPASRPSAGWALLVAAAVLVGGLLAAPRLSHSLWTDELFSVRRVLDGYWRQGDDTGALEFRHASWIDTFFYYRTPNNHVPFNVAARLSLEVWQAANVEPGSGVRFGESAMRLPAFVFGGLSIAAAALVWWRAGFPAAGALLAWMLALHPWHVRYASEVRGYSLLLLLVSAQIGALLAVLHRGTYPRWILYGVAQVLILWTYPLTGLLVVITNLGVLAALLVLHGLGPDGRGQVLRFAVANAASVLVLVQLYAPLAPQVLEYTAEQEKESLAAAKYLRNVGSHLYLGMPYRVTKVADAPYPQLFDAAQRAVPLHLQGGAALVLLSVGAGAVRLWRKGGAFRLLVPILLLPGPLTWLVAWLARMYLWEWYMLFMLPTWGALFALGVSAPTASRRPIVRGAGAVLCVLVLVGFALASEPMRSFQRDHPIQPRRESVLVTRPGLDPLAPSQRDVLTASFFVAPETYDPRVVNLDAPEELVALMARADRENLPLFVNVGWLDHARRREPGLVALVQREDLFEEVAMLPGLTPRFTRLVYRYRGTPTRSGPR